MVTAFYVSGCIVSIDAMGCQKEIAQTILERGADYPAVKQGLAVTSCGLLEQGPRATAGPPATWVIVARVDVHRGVVYIWILTTGSIVSMSFREDENEDRQRT